MGAVHIDMRSRRECCFVGICHQYLNIAAATVAELTDATSELALPAAPDRKRLEAGAVSELHGIARFKIHEGKLEEFKRLSAQCMEIVRTKDAGTLQYDIYFNDDQSECIVHERYRDSEALIAHTAHLGDLMEAILATRSVCGELLGEPSAELRAQMADSEVRLFTPFLSM
jgi:quinol monooxygenase YgiN